MILEKTKLREYPKNFTLALMMCFQMEGDS